MSKARAALLKIESLLPVDDDPYDGTANRAIRQVVEAGLESDRQAEGDFLGWCNPAEGGCNRVRWLAVVTRSDGATRIPMEGLCRTCAKEAPALAERLRRSYAALNPDVKGL